MGVVPSCPGDVSEHRDAADAAPARGGRAGRRRGLRASQRGADPFCADGNGATAVEMAELTEAKSAFPQLLALPALPPDRWYAGEPTSASSRSLAGAGGASTSRTRATATPSSPRGAAAPVAGRLLRADCSTRRSCRGRGPSPSGTARPSRRSRLMGTRVEARYEGGDEWYAGVIEGVRGYL